MLNVVKPALYFVQLVGLSLYALACRVVLLWNDNHMGLSVVNVLRVVYGVIIHNKTAKSDANHQDARNINKGR